MYKHGSSRGGRGETMDPAIADDREQVLQPATIFISSVLKSSPAILAAAKTFGVQVRLLEKCELARLDGLPSCMFVVDDFEEQVFYKTHPSLRLVGPTALLESLETKREMCNLSHPLYCLAMRDLTLCFSGFQDENHVSHLVHLVRAMAGKVASKMDSNVTHLVADTNRGTKYEYAAQHGIPIMTQEWILSNWEHRKMVGSLALDDKMLTYRYKPFTKLKICFYGYEQLDLDVMVRRLQENGGEAVPLEHPGCTHVVVNDLLAMSMPSPHSKVVAVVCATWFWYSVQCKACMPVAKFPAKVFESSSPHSSHSSSSRQWLPDVVLGTCSHMPKFEWETQSDAEEGTPHSTAQLHKQALLELLHTEQNYVRVLDVILQMKCEIESSRDILLAPTHIKLIFKNVQPIHKVHTQLLQHLTTANQDGSLEKNVGRIILKSIPDIRAAYPAYVNFFEDSRKTLLDCIENNPKLQRYLQQCKELPMCGRQTLEELMIRPIQRLGSLLLLLKSLLKTLHVGSSEHSLVSKAWSGIESVMMQVNEDKRRTDKLYKIFDIFNNINSCPPELVSANRQLVKHFEATELTNKLSGRGDLLIFYLFTDVLEVARVRSRAKLGRNVDCTGEQDMSSKPYKHISLIPLAKVWRFVDIRDTQCGPEAFAVAFRSNLAESYYVFALASDTINKTQLLKILCQQKANLNCKVNPEHLLLCKAPCAVGLTSCDISPVSITKAAKNLAIKAKKSMSHAFNLGGPRQRLGVLDMSCEDTSEDSGAVSGLSSLVSWT